MCIQDRHTGKHRSVPNPSERTAWEAHRHIQRLERSQGKPSVDASSATSRLLLLAVTRLQTISDRRFLQLKKTQGRMSLAADVGGRILELDSREGNHPLVVRSGRRKNAAANRHPGKP